MCYNFPEGKQLVTAPTANVCEGHQEDIKTDECVMVNREGNGSLGENHKMHSKWWSDDSLKFSYGHFLHKRN